VERRHQASCLLQCLSEFTIGAGERGDADIAQDPESPAPALIVSSERIVPAEASSPT